jgi:pilus assembly protein CpaF
MKSQDQTNRLAVLEPFLNDSEIMEILVDGHSHVYVSRRGEFTDVPSPFRDEAHLLDVIDAILAPLGRRADETCPMVDARLPDGSRVNIVVRPVSLIGPTLVIRKFPPKSLTVEDVLRFGSWNEDMVTFLRACIQGRLNMIVAGGVGSGKTSLLNILAGMIPADERIITVENAGELRLPPRLKRVVKLESRPPNVEGKGEVTMRDLVVNALRMRPDRLIAGEVRAGEALELFQAMNTGHDGTMMTVHASSLHDVLVRLEVAVTMANPALPLLTVRQMMASAIDLITYQERLIDGKRKMIKVAEVVGMQGDVVALRDIFEFRQTGMQDGQVVGHFTATGHIPGFFNHLREAGVDLPVSLFTPS